MYTVELTLKGSPMAVSVQRKEKEDAEKLYQSIVDMLQSGSAKLVELTCEKQEDKKLTVLTSEISAIQVSEKTGSASMANVGFGRS